MKSIHKKIKIRNKQIATFAIMCVCLVATVYTTIIHPQLSHAESRYMTASITGDDGEVDFSPGVDDAVVKFSYMKTSTHIVASKVYDAKITLNDLPITSDQKKLSVTLPVGMAWVDDASGDQNLLSQLDTSKGTNGVETVPLDREPVLGYSFPDSGTRVYYLTEGSKAATFNIKVRADRTVNLGYIANGVIARVDIGNESEEAKVDINVPTGASLGGLFASSTPTNYVSAGSTFFINKDFIRSSRSNIVMSNNYYSVTRLITKVKIAFHIEGNATMQSTSSNSQYTFDDSDAANGNYVSIYTPNTATSAYYAIPYSVTFSDDAAPGEVVTITAVGETSYWQPDGPDLTLQHRNSQTAKYIIAQNTEDVTVGWSSLDQTNVGSANDITVSSPVREGEGMTGMLGYGYVNNRGSVDSAPKKARLTFDASTLGVMALRLPCSPSGSIESVHIKTVGGVDKDVTVNAICTNYGTSAPVTYVDFGIERDDYITEIEYLLGVIPATTQLRYAAQNDGSRALMFVGRRLDESQPGISTIEVFDADNPERTTGVATITSEATSGSGGVNYSTIPTQVKSAGETLSFSFSILSYGADNGPGYNYGTRNPIIYLRSEAKDASGNFLPITNIRVTNGATRGNQDITSLFGQIMTIDTETARVYVLDGRNVADGLASLAANTISNSGVISSNQLDISFSINTSATTPSQSHNITNLVFVQDPDDSAITTGELTGDPFGISIVENGGMVRKATTNYYQIKQSASVLIENSGKHTSSDTWLPWSEGSNPITIGSAEGSAADMKISIMNNSGVEITEPVTAYSPIPKKDQDWGSLSYNNQPFEFSTTLDGPVSNPDSTHFTIAYGRNVTPTDNGGMLDEESTKFTIDTTGWSASDWQDVNCIRITSTNIPANQPSSIDTYDFVYRLKVVGSDSTSDGLVNTWRPLFFQQLVNSAGDTFAGWYKGSYVSLQLANGTIFGEIFVDVNENGKKDAGEQSLQEAGWKIDLYDKTSDRLVRSVETNASGRYDIIELITSPDSYYIVVTNKHPLGETGTTYLFTPKGVTSNTGAYNTDNQAEGDKTSTPAHTTARITPVSPSQTANEASYNIGVVEYAETTAYSGNVAFDDQDNRFGTRPDTITITIEGDDGSQHTADVDTTGNGDFTVDLPKYNNEGDQINYSFSLPDIPNYDRVEQPDGTTSYTQKTATLTVHYYKTGSTTPLIPDSTTTVYWGQRYEAPQGAVDADYELDFADGDVSGTVAGDITVTYYYKKRVGTVTTHYRIKDTNTPIAADTAKDYEYGEIYTTTPLDQIPAEFANYELVSEHPAGYTGTVRAANTEVTYSYQKKDPQIESEISLVGPETLDSKDSPVSYSVNYSVHATDYIGNTKTTLVMRLPYPIVEEESDLGDGVYDAENRTIIWTVEAPYNSYTDGDINIEHGVRLVFSGANADDMLVTTIEASIELDGKTNAAVETIRTFVQTPAVITFQFVDQDGNQIKEPEQREGYVGKECDFSAPEIDGYTLSTDEGIDLTFTEEARVIVYRYQQTLEVPDTSGLDSKSQAGEVNNSDLFTLIIYMFSSSSIALIVLVMTKLRKHAEEGDALDKN